MDIPKLVYHVSNINVACLGTTTGHARIPFQQPRAKSTAHIATTPTARFESTELSSEPFPKPAKARKAMPKEGDRHNA